jgi:hypothetical protein
MRVFIIHTTRNVVAALPAAGGATFIYPEYVTVVRRERVEIV